MPTLDARSRELLCKVVFAGAPGAGVGTTFRELWALIPDAASSAVIPGPKDPPVYRLRFRPRPVLRVQGLDISFDLLGYEGDPQDPEFLAAIRGTDAMVITVDSGPRALEANRRAIDAIQRALTEVGSGIDAITVLLQYNKRDLSDALSIRDLETKVNEGSWPFVATSASRSQGLQELLDRIAAEVSSRVSLPGPTRRGPGPTDSMTTAFSRVEKRLFGRVADEDVTEDDEDRTVLADSDSGQFRAVGSPTSMPPTAAPPTPPTAAPPTPPADVPPVASPRATPPPATRPEGEKPAPGTEEVAVPAPAERPGRFVADQAESTLKTPDVVDVEVPDLGGYRVKRLGKPEVVNPRWISLPIVAEGPAAGGGAGSRERVEVDLRIKLGGSQQAARTPNPQREDTPHQAQPASQAMVQSLSEPAPAAATAPAADRAALQSASSSPRPGVKTARKEPPRRIPTSYWVFGAVLVVVVVIALIAGSTLN